MTSSQWLVSSVGRALRRYRRGHEFKSRTCLNFFRPYFSYWFNNVDSIFIYLMCCSVAKDNSEGFFWMAEDALTETAIKAVSYKIAVSKKAEKSIQTPT